MTSYSFAQGSVWNKSTLKFTRDTVQLLDISGGTQVSYNGPFNSTITSEFPDGFKFRLGLDTLNKYSISAYGYIKFGSAPNAVNINPNDTVISALFHFPDKYPRCITKLVGEIPRRKFIIQWGDYIAAGNQGFGFQLILHETTGTVEIRYSGVRNVASYPIIQLIQTKILGLKAIASLVTKPGTQPWNVDYQSMHELNYNPIPAGTRLIFQPDTNRLIAPSGLTVKNLSAGCFDINFTDASDNESLFRIERKQSEKTLNFVDKFISTPGDVGSTVQIMETMKQPDSTYEYAVFASNGFQISDTQHISIHTLPPQISGIKKIPGDYPSINSLLEDARCRHLGPELVIELQGNYKYADEGKTVNFFPFLNTRKLNSVTIRPAVGIQLKLENPFPGSMFLIDSVKHIAIDGRAGGTGNGHDLTLFQNDSLNATVSFVRFADSGILRNCKITSRSRNMSGVVYIGTKGLYGEGVNGSLIYNNKIGPESGMSYNAIVVQPSFRGYNITVRENEIFNFYRFAFYQGSRGYNTKFIRNRIYQPNYVSFIPHVSQPVAAVYFEVAGDGIKVDSNFIGGNRPEFGSGTWQQWFIDDKYSLIRIDSYLYALNGNSISHNQISGLAFTGATTIRIEYQGNYGYIIGNKLTEESGQVIENSQKGIEISGTGKYSHFVKDNFISGIKSSQSWYGLLAGGMDTLIVENNDFGGSDDPLRNQGHVSADAIRFTQIKYASIRKNQIRGFYSPRLGEFIGMIGSVSEAFNVDSNKIHHISFINRIYGMNISFGGKTHSTVKGNECYAFITHGPHSLNPSICTGMLVSQSDLGEPLFSSTESLTIEGNYVHSFEHRTPYGSYPFSVTGISARARNLKILNNIVSLGHGASGKPTDSLEMDIVGINVGQQKKRPVFIEHNTIHISGGGGATLLKISGDRDSKIFKHYFISNNIFSNDKGHGFINPDGGSPISNVVSNNNIFYSSRIPGVENWLSRWRTMASSDSASLAIDPEFVNPYGDSLSRSLHVKFGSPAESNGTPAFSDPVNDYDGESRKDLSPVDIGADALNPCTTQIPPIILNISDDGNIQFCPGDSLNLQMITNGNGLALQWQRNMLDIENATTEALTVREAGTYRLVAKKGCNTVASKSINITNLISAPRIKLHRTDIESEFCTDGQIDLEIIFDTKPLQAPEFKWYRNYKLVEGKKGIKEVFTNIQRNEIFTAEAIFKSTCHSSSIKDSITLKNNFFTNTHSKINVSAIDTFLCHDKTTDTLFYSIVEDRPSRNKPLVLFNTGSSIPDYKFEGDDKIIFTNIHSDFSFRLFMPIPGNFFCYIPDTTDLISIHVQSPIPTPVVELNGNTLTSNAPAGNQWYRLPDQMISGATQQFLELSSAGEYFVRVYINGCASEASNSIFYQPRFITGDTILKAFPNPSVGEVWLVSESWNGDIDVKLLNQNGTLIKSSKLEIKKGVPLKLQYQNLPVGLYIISAKHQGKEKRIKILFN